MVTKITRTRLADQYLRAKEFVENQGFGNEIDWQETRRPSRVGESAFLSEAAWVILSSGLSERSVRAVFPSVSDAFLQWESAGLIYERRTYCANKAIEAFAHLGKIQAIAHIAGHVAHQGFRVFMDSLIQLGPSFLQQFPYFGPATSRHLSKNLGLNVAKPDRHLQRVAESTGLGSTDVVCELIADELGERIDVVDVVIWRFATLNKSYLEHFSMAT